MESYLILFFFLSFFKVFFMLNFFILCIRVFMNLVLEKLNFFFIILIIEFVVRVGGILWKCILKVFIWRRFVRQGLRFLIFEFLRIEFIMKFIFVCYFLILKMQVWVKLCVFLWFFLVIFLKIFLRVCFDDSLCFFISMSVLVIIF